MKEYVTEQFALLLRRMWQPLNMAMGYGLLLCVCSQASSMYDTACLEG